MWSSEREITVLNLKPGMYISRLDRPWMGTSFPVQGFMVEDSDDIDKLCSYCETVFIDVYKCQTPQQFQAKIEQQKAKKREKIGSSAKHLKKGLARHAIEKYAVKSSFKREISKALPIIKHIEKEINRLVTPGGYIHRRNLRKIISSTSDLVESVIRNPDAMVWLCRIKNNNGRVYQHALRLSILGCLVGRQLGLNRFSLVDLTLALMMTGIGKSFIEMDVLEELRFDRTPDSYRHHIDITLDKLYDCKLPGLDIKTIIESYCERIDGSGYPAGKQGEEISLLAKVAGLVEYFELQIHPFNPKFAKSPSAAITELNRLKDTLFDAALIEKFVQSIGIYPTGTLIELNDNRVGIVCSQSYEKRLRASIIPLTTTQGDAVDKYQILDLYHPNQWQLSEDKLRIRKGLPMNTLPLQIVDEAQQWLFKKNYGAWGKVRSMVPGL